MEKLLKFHHSESNKIELKLRQIKHSIFYFMHAILKTDNSSLGIEIFIILLEMFQLIAFSFHLCVYKYI